MRESLAATKETTSRMAMRPSSRFRAFALLEVLIVVAVIALLAAILLVSLGKARAQARRAACLSNLSQIALGWQQYLEAHRGAFLQLVNANYNYGGKQGDGSSLFGADPAKPVPKPLNRYLGLPLVTRTAADVFRCPADTGSDSERPTNHDYYGTSYTTNHMLVGQNQLPVQPLPPDPCLPLKIKINQRLKDLNRDRIANESRLLLAGDFGWVFAFNRNSTRRVEWHDRKFHHDIAFMDGHAEFVRIRKGMYVTDKYTLVPFRDLQDEACQCQQEIIEP